MPEDQSGLRIAFVGLGGAGQRHVRTFRSLLGTSTGWLGVRQRGTTPVLSASFETQSSSMADAYHLDLVPSLAEAIDAGIDLVVIATPTSMHASAAIEALNAGCPVLVEKPLAASSADATHMACAATNSSMPLFVSFQRRFHPAWTLTQAALQSRQLGILDTVEMWTKSDVSTWHPYEPLRELYAVRADLGGGAIRTECHELDQVIGLFGTPLAVRCSSEEGHREDEVERSAEIELDYGPGKPSVTVSLSLSATTPERGWKIAGSQGELTWNESTGVLVIDAAENRRESRVTGFDNERLVTEQNQWVLDHLTHRARTVEALDQAVATSYAIDAALQALNASQ